MTQITSEMLADMHDRRLRGETGNDIAAKHNVKPMAVYQRLRREYGTKSYPKAAANDNASRGRTVRMMPHNGGCSTLSGARPVSLARVATLEQDLVGARIDARIAEREALVANNDNSPQPNVIYRIWTITLNAILGFVKKVAA